MQQSVVDGGEERQLDAGPGLLRQLQLCHLCKWPLCTVGGVQQACIPLCLSTWCCMWFGAAQDTWYCASRNCVLECNFRMMIVAHLAANLQRQGWGGIFLLGPWPPAAGQQEMRDQQELRHMAWCRRDIGNHALTARSHESVGDQRVSSSLGSMLYSLLSHCGLPCSIRCVQASSFEHNQASSLLALSNARPQLRCCDLDAQKEAVPDCGYCIMHCQTEGFEAKNAAARGVLLLRLGDLGFTKVCPATADPSSEGPQCPSNHTLRPYLHTFLVSTPFLTLLPLRTPRRVRKMKSAKMSALQSSHSTRKAFYNKENNINEQVCSAVGLDSNALLCHQLERVQLKAAR